MHPSSLLPISSYKDAVSSYPDMLLSYYSALPVQLALFPFLKDILLSDWNHTYDFTSNQPTNVRLTLFLTSVTRCRLYDGNTTISPTFNFTSP